MCYTLAQWRYKFADVNKKKEVNMWFAVIVSVSLAVEVLSYISGGEINININNRDAA